MFVINKADRKAKYDTYPLENGRKLLVSKTSGNQFEQTTAGKNVYKKVPADDLYDVSGVEPEAEAEAAAAPAPATGNAAAKEAAYQRFRADPARRMLPTSYDKRIIDMSIDNPMFSQKEISERTGVSQSTVSRVLKSARGSY
jgi:DNA-directed RNA polymerase specialized sigma24 family protein